ncbi:MAG: hypothetical protein ABIY62_00320 [Ginsengibacter sp.]
MKERVLYSEYFYEKGSKDTDTLEKSAFDYPLSSLASFLLLYHYKKTAHLDFEKLAKKTVLLFNNSQWLQFQLSHNSDNKSLEPANLTSANLPEEKELPQEISKELPKEISSEQNFLDEPKNIISESDDTGTPEEKFNAGHELINDSSSSEKNNDEQEQIEINSSNNIANHFHHDLPAEKETSQSEEPMAFEPLHTVDYFASQGIKIDDQIITNDKLGSQMKSFTEWLKSMKRLHPSKLEEVSSATEKLVQNAANESNVNTEVLTEAMAEVLIKQDKKEKAIEMFSKLSLINPSKSAYFAAKIESIKSS